MANSGAHSDAGADGRDVVVVAHLHNSGRHLQRVNRCTCGSQPPRRSDRRVPGERQLGERGVDASVRGGGTGGGQIDENRFAVT